MIISAQEPISAEEYEVYSAWLKTWFIPNDVKQVTIRDTTSGDYDRLRISPEKVRSLKRLEHSTYRNFKAEKDKESKLEDRFDVATPVTIVSKDIWLYLPPDKSTEKMVGKFIDLRLSFSRVGFNRKRDQALFHVNFVSKSDTKLMFGYYYLLTKINGQWTVNQSVKSWEY